MRKFMTLVIVAALALGVLVGCGGGSTGATQQLTVEMGANGKWRFSPETLNVNKGDTVQVKLVNVDKEQAHSFTIADLNVQSDQIPAGKTGSVTFKASKTGSFQFYCNVPGHKADGMVGTINVK